MSEIRYWQSGPVSNTASQAKKEQTQKLSEVNNSFTQQMADLLMSSNNDPLFDVFGQNQNITDTMFGDEGLDAALNSRLSGIKNEGMEKVWAARMQNELPFSDWESGNKKNSKDNDWMSGFGNIIELTVKMQMAQAKKQLQHLDTGSHRTLDEFIGAADPVSHQQPTLQQAVSDIQTQIDQTAKKLGIDVSELKAKIL